MGTPAFDSHVIKINTQEDETNNTSQNEFKDIQLDTEQEKFAQWIKSIATYLSQKLNVSFSDLHKGSTRIKTFRLGLPIILKSEESVVNPYVDVFIDIMKVPYYIESPYEEYMDYDTPIFYSNDSDSLLDDLFRETYSIQSRINLLYEGYILGKSLRTEAQIQSGVGDTSGVVRINKINSNKFLSLYTVFWNIFLAYLNEENFRKQISVVSELTQYLRFDEHIMRDLCHGVRYVLSGNMFCPDCGLECETKDGREFMLHR